MKAIIIDDEPKARNILKVLIEENCPKIKEVFQAEDLLTGVKIIQNQAPHIVFLDIEMPEHSGLEILNFIEKEVVDFEIIFTTAYSDYAVQAFQLAAIDYLLKPVSSKQVKNAVDKCLALIGKSNISSKLTELKASLASSNFKKIGLPVSNGIKFVSFEEIVMLEADGMYTKITLEKEDEILISKPLKHFVELLKNIPLFYRPHRSFLINLKYVSQYIKSDGGYILMDNGTSVTISKENRDQFLTLISSI
ncbi:MAG: LytTR family DNA-binding domain-containing protein [Ekhidna sp.]